MKTLTNVNARDAKHAVALSQQARKDGQVSAFNGGGSDLLGMVKERIVSPDILVNLRAIKGLDQVSSARGMLNVGGLITLDELMAKLREQGVDKLEQVKAATMESDGEISVIKFDLDPAPAAAAGKDGTSG